MKIFKVTEKKKNLFTLKEEGEELCSSLILKLRTSQYPLEVGDVAIFKYGVNDGLLEKSETVIDYDDSTLPLLPYFTVSFQDKKDLKEFLKRNYKTENNEDILFLYNFFSSESEEVNVLTKINSTFAYLIEYNAKNFYNFGFEEKFKYYFFNKKIQEIFNCDVNYKVITQFYKDICDQIYARCFYLLGLKDSDIKNYLYFTYHNIFTEKKKSKKSVLTAEKLKKIDEEKDCTTIKNEWGWDLSSYSTVKDNFIEDIFIFLKKNPYLFINRDFLSEKIVRCYYHPSVFATVNNQLFIFAKLYKKVFSSQDFYVDISNDSEKVIEILQEKTKILKKVYNLIFIKETKRLYINSRFEMEKLIKNFVSKNNIQVITGGPGTGKTTLISQLEKENPNSIIFLSFTGKAVCKIKEKVMKKSECKTMHCAIIDKQKERREKNTSYFYIYDTIIIDETSMVPAELFYELFIKTPVKFSFKKLFLIGDPNQLPPIDWGNVFQLIINEVKKDNLKILTVNYRQNDYLKKVVNTFLETGTLQDFDSKFILNYSSNEGLKTILSSLKANKPDNLLFISPINSMCDLVNDLFCKGFIKGEKMILNQNIYIPSSDGNDETGSLIPNGAIGEIVIEKKQKKVKMIDDNSNPQLFDLIEGEKLFSLCYCLTVHKMQGSECDDLILILPESCLDFVDKKLLYTAISRPKNKLIILTNIQDIKKKKFH
jgi:ATP-dependent exoDNAse (exonuclease V) alpha subunit